MSSCSLSLGSGGEGEPDSPDKRQEIPESKLLELLFLVRVVVDMKGSLLLCFL